MKLSTRILAPTLVLIFVSSLLIGFTENMNTQTNPEPLEERVVQNAPSDPGHSVFAQYITSDNCGYCYSYGSPAHNQAKTSLPDRYVYISYHSANFGNTADAESGNIAPIYAVQHLQESGGAPKTSFGDATLNTGCGSNTCWDSYISSGGNMHSTASDYQVSVTQTDNGDGTVDVSVSASYVGSGTAPSSITMYAAVTEKVCNSHVYADGSKGGNCWEAWLLNSGAYAHNGGNVGSGTGFETVNLNAGQAVKTWTVPTSLVNGGVSNMNTVAALYSTWSTSSFNADVFAASDSTMAPKLDLAVTSLDVSVPGSPNAGFMIGDTTTLDVTVRNVGDLDYSDGGTIQFFYKNGANEVSISSLSLNNLNSQQVQTGQTTFDTTGLPSKWTTSFGARISGLVGDGNGANNVAIEQVDQDRPPETKNPQIQGDQLIERGSHAVVLVKADANDNLDSASTTTFNVEISPTGLDQWTSSVISGGQNVVYQGTTNEGREYIITPSSAMSAGWYDVRSQAMDSRGQTGDWKTITGSSGFELKNGVPTIVTDPIPSVMCDTPTKVSMVGHISDPETPLENLILTSDSDAFVAWHAATKELEVHFAWSELNGCPLGQQGMEVTMDDGGDYSSSGELPYGTLLFSVTENGQPRWNGLPAQSIVEGGSGILALMPFLSDTYDNGNPSPSEDLNIELISNSNEAIIDAYLIGNTIGFDAVDDDANGQAILTLRASDGIKTSEATLTVNIQPINDAPRLSPFDDIESITLKRNSIQVIDLSSRIIDVDNPAEEAFVTVTPSEAGAARYSFIDGSLTLEFEQTGMQTVTVVLQDKFDTNTYVMNIDVFDSFPLLISDAEGDSGYMTIGMEDTYIGQTPTVTMLLTDNSPSFTIISATWNICSSLTGTCDGLMEYNLDMSKSNTGWSTELLIQSVLIPGKLAREDGSQYKDYYQLTMTATDSDGNDYKTMTELKWDITETMPTIEEMDDVMFEDYLDDLNSDKLKIVEQIEALEDGSDSTSLDTELSEIEAELDLACSDSRADCIDESLSSSNAEEVANEVDYKMIGLIGGIILFGLVIGLMFTRRGARVEKLDPWNDTGWNPNLVPAHDVVANSMYGGAQEIFQQPVALAPTQQMAGPPLPPGGLPAGWSAEQWAYYGQQYLDGTL